MAKRKAPIERLREHALSLPEAVEDFPWGDRVAKVRAKMFAMFGEGVLVVKLLASLGAAHGMPGVEPMRYNLGKHGWVRVTLADGPPVEILIDWIDESYDLIAPKSLVSQRGS